MGYWARLKTYLLKKEKLLRRLYIAYRAMYSLARSLVLGKILPALAGIKFIVFILLDVVSAIASAWLYGRATLAFLREDERRLKGYIFAITINFAASRLLLLWVVDSFSTGYLAIGVLYTVGSGMLFIASTKKKFFKKDIKQTK